MAPCLMACVELTAVCVCCVLWSCMELMLLFLHRGERDDVSVTLL